MAGGPEARDLSAQFAEEYLRAQTPIMVDLERAVCGCDYGGTSWTTREEADRIRGLLGLGKGTRLLEIGAGSGWPALYLAQTSGCDATLADIPLAAIRIASDRVRVEPPTGAITMTVADGSALPFRDGRFDTISHSDVLCCLAPKRQVLVECRRVIRDGGRMVFSVIYTAPNLSATDYNRAVEAGPPYMESEAEYPHLLDETGWLVDERIDVSVAYEETGRRHIREVEAREAGMRALLGDEEYTEMLERRYRNVRVVAEGLVRRELFSVCPRPG